MAKYQRKAHGLQMMDDSMRYDDTNSTSGDTLSGIVDSIVFKSEESGYTVCIIEDSAGLPITAVGTMPYLTEGDRINAFGRWTTHKIYGRQFTVENFERSLPADEDDILRYLSSGAVRGIGPKTAQKIVEKFGSDAFEVIENNPEWLASIGGISKAKAEKISENFKSISNSREFLMFSKDFFSPSTAMKIYKRWGNSAVSRIRENPYSLCGTYRGIGFKRADLIAQSLGIALDSSFRIEAGILHVLSAQASGAGHSCVPLDSLIKLASELLFDSNANRTEQIASAIDEMSASGKIKIRICGDTKYIYHPYIYRAESYTAEKLTALLRLCPAIDENDISLFIEKSEAESRIRYAPSQKAAIYDALKNGVMVLTGGPGTGKTTIIKGLISIFDSLEMSVCLAAPTGRAAKRMSEATSHEAKTIHRLLEVEYSSDDETNFARCESNPLDERVIIIDEASMIDTILMDSLLRAIRGGSRLILIGDSDQLPSVGCGSVLDDIISSGIFRVNRLTEIFRQSESSKIITNAHLINLGKMPEISSRGTDFFFLRRGDDESTAATVCDLIHKRLPKTYGTDIVEKIQIITPSRKGASGTESLNSMLQSVLNPPSGRKSEHRHKTTVFRAGDRVMQTKNDYQIEWSNSLGDSGFGIYNGDIGTVESIDTDNEIMRVVFDGKRYEYDFTMLDELEHAYAVTVHKSQGSEYPVVIIPLYRCAPMLQSRNLLYTAVTRGSKMVILVGEEEILRRMVENNYHAARCTGLKELLASASDSVKEGDYN